MAASLPRPPDDQLTVGDTTKALREAWNKRVSGDNLGIKSDSIRQLFHDLELFPSNRLVVYSFVSWPLEGQAKMFVYTFS